MTWTTKKKTYGSTTTLKLAMSKIRELPWKRRSTTGLMVHRVSFKTSFTSTTSSFMKKVMIFQRVGITLRRHMIKEKMMELAAMWRIMSGGRRCRKNVVVTNDFFDLAKKNSQALSSSSVFLIIFVLKPNSWIIAMKSIQSPFRKHTLCTT